MQTGHLEKALEIMSWVGSTGTSLTKTVTVLWSRAAPAHFPTPLNILSNPWSDLPSTQAGQLEKALEIMSWVSSTGMAFNDKTYDGLINTVEIAQVSPDEALVFFLYVQHASIRQRSFC